MATVTFTFLKPASENSRSMVSLSVKNQLTGERNLTMMLTKDEIDSLKAFIEDTHPPDKWEVDFVDVN